MIIEEKHNLSKCRTVIPVPTVASTKYFCKKGSGNIVEKEAERF